MQKKIIIYKKQFLISDPNTQKSNPLVEPCVLEGKSALIFSSFNLQVVFEKLFWIKISETFSDFRRKHIRGRINLKQIVFLRV